jgi:hypothetical protein
MIYSTKKIDLINTLTIEIEKDFNQSFSVLAYDSEGLIWIEKFSDTLVGAEKLAHNLEKKLCKPFTYN